jgi:protoporphyrinogen IX oxidase
MADGLKIIHVLAVFAWMAGSESDQLFRTMERRLLIAIMTPAAIASWVFGLAAAWSGGWLSPVQNWLLMKLALVLLLTAFHVFLMACQRGFAREGNRWSARFYRMVNEIPTLLLIGIVILVVAKPFT